MGLNRGGGWGTGPAKTFNWEEGTKAGPLALLISLNHEAKNLVGKKDKKGATYLRKSFEILCHRCERNKRKAPTRGDGWTYQTIHEGGVSFGLISYFHTSLGSTKRALSGGVFVNSSWTSSFFKAFMHHKSSRHESNFQCGMWCLTVSWPATSVTITLQSLLDFAAMLCTNWHKLLTSFPDNGPSLWTPYMK